MVVPKPMQIEVGTLAVIVGEGFTTTVTLVLFLQPLPSTPVTLYRLLVWILGAVGLTLCVPVPMPLLQV